ncbi:MAG: phospholipase [Gemmatimonadota bacterium]|nr:phospholipase [Gemmatimonadota bacterium]
MQEHPLTVSRSARYYTLGTIHPGVRQIWLVCHGYGQLAARFLRHFEPLDDGRRLIIAPEGLSRFYVGDEPGTSHAGGQGKVGATWMTREDRSHEIDDYVRFLDEALAHATSGLGRSTARLIALGFSQGAATITRWAGRTRAAPADLVLWGGTVPEDADVSAGARAFGGARLSLVIGTKDGYATDALVARERSRLEGAGIPHRLIRFDGGHHLDDAVLVELARD